MLSVTGQFIFSVFMALSQFVEPYSAQQIQSFSKDKTLETWEEKAYNFKPLPLSSLSGLSETDLAWYLRSSCVRVITATQTEKSIARGKLANLEHFSFLMSMASESGVLEKFQKKLLKEEQSISLVSSEKYIKEICDVSVPIENLVKHKMVDAINYFTSMHKELPQINKESDLPVLGEVSFVKDLKGVLIGEYKKHEMDKKGRAVRKNRRRVRKGSIPTVLKKALVAIEDNKFWNFKKKGAGYKGHKGVDFKGMVRAIQVSGSGDSVQGASTLTMQLAKNLILYKDVFNEQESGKRSLVRKLKEYILVDRLEKALTKDQILNWYLDTIDFGRSSQGVFMAAQSYFGKTPGELSLSDSAFLAGLPKSPNSLDPNKNYKKAKSRRNKVLKDMKKQKFISKNQYVAARKLELGQTKGSVTSEAQGYASHYVNAIESKVDKWAKRVGRLKGEGYDVITPINHEYQKWAVESLQRGLLSYERRRKIKGKKILTVKPYEDRLPNIKDKVEELAKVKNESVKKVFSEVLSTVKNQYPDASQFKIGVILSDKKIGLKDGSQVNRQPEDRKGKLFKVVNGKKTSLKVWDVVMLEEFKDKKGKSFYKIASFTSTQGGVVVIDNRTGDVLATAGGFSVGVGHKYSGASGNKAFSAFRQPGSTVKPFTYLYAMGKNLSPVTVVPNVNVVMPIKKVGGQRLCNKWSLKDTGEKTHYTLRRGLEKSKNRLTLNTFLKASGVKNGDDLNAHAEVLGVSIDKVLEGMKRYGLYPGLKNACYPIMLGARETTAVEVAAAYSTIARGGVFKNPVLIKGVLKNDKSVGYNHFGQAAKAPLTQKEQFNLFRVRTMLQGVVKRGTARSMSNWSELIAGKTGTTNNSKDAWFVGFNKTITVAVWVGHPKNKSLGYRYQGSNVALPIFKDFMTSYYKKHPEKLNDKFSNTPPTGGYVARVEPSTGFLLDQNLKDDFKYFTGIEPTVLKTEVEYFHKEDMTRPARYTGESVKAGLLFFNNMSAGFKKGYEKDYLEYRRALILELEHYNEKKRECIAVNDERHASCLYVQQTERPDLSKVNLTNFYLQKMSFTK